MMTDDKNTRDMGKHAMKLDSDVSRPKNKKKKNKKKHKESLEDKFGEKLCLENFFCPLEKTEATECKHRSGVKLPLGKVSSSRKKSNATTKEFLENDVFRSGEKTPLDSLELKPDEYFDYFPQTM